jgi:hypothetical protein
MTCEVVLEILHIKPKFISTFFYLGARGSVDGWDTVLQAGRSRVRFPMRSLDFSIDLILRALAVASTQPLAEMSSKNLRGGKWPVHKAENLTAIYEPTV